MKIVKCNPYNRYSAHYLRFLHGPLESCRAVRVRSAELCAATHTISILMRGKGKSCLRGVVWCGDVV